MTGAPDRIRAFCSERDRFGDIFETADWSGGHFCSKKSDFDLKAYETNGVYLKATPAREHADELVGALMRAKIQLEYLNDPVARGTTNAEISHIDRILAKIK